MFRLQTPLERQWLELTSESSYSALELSQAANHDGVMFTCALTGGVFPLEHAHQVTVKQLLRWHVANERGAENGKAVEGQTPTSAGTDIPLVIRRAYPSLRAKEFRRCHASPKFLLSKALVCESAAVTLLKGALEVCHQ